MQLVIIGGVAAGAACAARARRLDEFSSIMVLERGPHVSFANCGLPYFVGGEIQHSQALLVQTPQSLGERFNLDVRVNTEVLSLDRQNKTVECLDLAAGEKYAVAYDKLVLAPGAAPLRPPIPGIERPGHFVVRTIPDVTAIKQWCQEKDVKRAVVVGGGFIGLEMVEQLSHLGLEVDVVEAANQVMAPLDVEMASWLASELKRNGVNLHLQDGVVAFEPRAEANEPGSVVVLKSGAQLVADLVVLGIGVRPEVQLAVQSGLELGATRGIKVDEYLNTSDPNIWAIGDVAEVTHLVTRQKVLLPLAGPASKQGRLAADNIMGRKAAYKGALGTAVLRLFKLTAACTGANERALQAAGMPYQALHVHVASHASYYPGASTMALKLLFDLATGKVLGAQAVGQDGVDKRIDVISACIKMGASVFDLEELDLCYAPPFGSAKDPVNIAGMAAANVCRGLVKTAQWSQVGQDDTFILDVRSQGERNKGAIPGSHFIPLDQLRSRLEELPKDRLILVHCQSGQRSYFACRVLAQRGFNVVNLSGSYRTWSALQDS